jgi:hypothetical protein
MQDFVKGVAIENGSGTKHRGVRAPRTAEGHAASGCGRGSPPPANGVGGVTLGNFFLFMQNLCILEHFGDRNRHLTCTNMTYFERILAPLPANGVKRFHHSDIFFN